MAGKRVQFEWPGMRSGNLRGSLCRARLTNPGSKVVCIREIQKTLNQSAKALIESTIQDRIETPGGGMIIFQGMHAIICVAGGLLFPSV